MNWKLIGKVAAQMAFYAAIGCAVGCALDRLSVDMEGLRTTRISAPSGDCAE